MKKSGLSVATFTVVSTLWASAAGAAIVPFTETFTDGPENWFVNSGGTEIVGWVPTVPAGDGFAAVALNFSQTGAMDFPVLFRAHDNFDSSNDSFVGNWLMDGVTELRALVRHDAEVPMSFFARIATSGNFPAAATLPPVMVQPNEWTELVIPIEEGSFVFEGPSNFFSVFGNVGNLQFGPVPGALAGVDTTVTFALDNVSIVPEPATLGLLVVGAGLATWRGRRRNHS